MLQQIKILVKNHSYYPVNKIRISLLKRKRLLDSYYLVRVFSVGSALSSQNCWRLFTSSLYKGTPQSLRRTVPTAMHVCLSLFQDLAQ